ncbi:MAG: hypothetical protein U0U70_02095 [Chitinophagaceae bacterium]
MQAGNTSPDESVFNSYLSFKPLVTALKKNIAEGNPGMQKLYGQVVASFEQHPELMEAIPDQEILAPYKELIEELLSAVFPPTTTNYMYGVALPFKFQAVYVSPTFKANLIKPGTSQIIIPEVQMGQSLSQEKLNAAYGIILKKYLNYPAPDAYRSIYPYTDPATGLTRYMELRLDTRFIEVRPKGDMPKMPDSIMDHHNNRIMKLHELMHQIPLEEFVFEGITVMRLNDVTEQAVIAEIKNKLLEFDPLSEATGFTELETHVQSLISIKNLSIGITPFFKINGHYVYSDLHNTNSILFRNLRSSPEKDEISDYCKLLFRENNQPLLFETLTEQMLADVQCLQYYKMGGAASLIVCPLKQGDNLVGLLEIISTEPGQLKPIHISKIEAALPLFTLGLEKTLEQLNYEVDKTIKKKFTAVQPAVEWKFTEVSLEFIVNQRQSKDIHIKRITFDEVWPLYAAVDIRNSSVERSQAIKADIQEQLELAMEVVQKAKKHLSFPLMEELEFKIRRYAEAASGPLQTEEEMSINEFLKVQVNGVFNHLHKTEPTLKNDIEYYLTALDPQVGMLYRHRKEYEASVTKINETLSRYIDKEQHAAQKVYPHYFERYVTDGLEFNIYIGQSISPRKKFDEIYLHNLKMWQLTVLTKAARKTHRLEQELSHRLRTTQLILCFSQPLAVTFRTEERKFDVDGTYNVRYEIVKKRIDKAHIRNTEERITQPGKIAIIYSQARDAAEYMEYIEFLQSQGLLKPGIERHDLEDLQGVSGLKALRVDVNFEEEHPQTAPVELSSTTSQDLVGK